MPPSPAIGRWVGGPSFTGRSSTFPSPAQIWQSTTHVAWLGGSTGAVQLSFPAGIWDGGRKVSNSRVACCRSLGIRCSPRSTPDAPIRRPSRGRHGSGYLSCPRAPAGGPLAELLGMSAGQVGRGPAAPERVAPDAERAPSAALPSVSVGARPHSAASSGGRFSAGMRAGVGAQGRLRDRSGRADACGPDDMRRVASGGRHGTSSARDGRISHANRTVFVPSARSRSACRMYGDVHWYTCKCRTQWVQSLICYLNTLSHGRVS